MKKDDLIILVIALLLLGAMLLTVFFGGAESRHGVGQVFTDKAKTRLSSQDSSRLKLGAIRPAGTFGAPCSCLANSAQKGCAFCGPKYA